MNPDLQRILESKAAHRRKLADLPSGEMLRLLDAMRALAAGHANAYLNYKRHIQPLLVDGLLEMTLPDKPNSRLQKYRLTEKGRSVLS